MDKTIFSKIEKLQEQYGINKYDYTTVMLAIVEMDYLQDITQKVENVKEKNKKKLNIDTICNTFVGEPDFNRIVDMDIIMGDIDIQISSNILPEVQLFRLLLDTLTYCVARDFKDKLPKDIKFTMPSTSRVAKLENVYLGHCDYSDIKECQEFFDLFSLDKQKECFTDKEYEYISNMFELYSKVKDKVNLDCINFIDTCKELYLPEKYSSYGFTVLRDNTKKSLNKETCIDFINTCYYYLLLSVFYNKDEYACLFKLKRTSVEKIYLGFSIKYLDYCSCFTKDFIETFNDIVRINSTPNLISDLYDKNDLYKLFKEWYNFD